MGSFQQGTSIHGLTAHGALHSTTTAGCACHWRKPRHGSPEATGIDAAAARSGALRPKVALPQQDGLSRVRVRSCW